MSANRRGARIINRLFILLVALCLGPQAFAHGTPAASHARIQHRELRAASSLSLTGLSFGASAGRRGVVRRAMGLEGDYSLSLVTVMAQDSDRFVHYSVRLQFASGAEQSIAVTAPPGGLKFEMRDMTGDRVPNDLLLTPALLAWAPEVLINDGHDHFTVAISGGPEGSLGSDRKRLSEGQNFSSIAALLSSGFEPFGLVNASGTLPPEPEAYFAFASQEIVANLCPVSSEPGRAPPAPATTI